MFLYRNLQRRDKGFTKYILTSLILLLDMDAHNKKKLEIKENQDQGGVYIKDCLIKVAHNALDLEKALKDGNKNKSMGET